MTFFVQRRLQRENKPPVSVDNIKDIIGSQLIVPRRGTGHESPACVESLQSDSNVKSALCSLASTKTIMERRPSYSNLAEESSFLSRKRAHSLNGSCDSLDQHRSHAASAAFAAARRPRRRPIDPFRELIVLVPGDVDDQIRKMGLTPAEIPEFLLCLDEQVDYDEEGDEEEETANGRHEERGAAVVVPSIKMEVYTPTVRINQFYEARQKKGCGFNIRSLAPQIGCCHYDEYEADSEDEKFLTNLDLKYEELSRSVKNSKAFLKGEVKGTMSKNHSLVTGEKSAGGAATAASELEERSNQGDKNEKQKQNSARHHTSDSSLGLQIESDGGNDDGDINRMDLQVDTVESSGLKESTKSKSNAVEVEPRSSMVFVPESVFQRMFAALERELEVAKGMESLLKETKTLHTKCAHLLEHSKTASELIETFLAEDSEDDSDIEKQMKKGKENKGGEEKNMDSIRSLEELILASKREQKLEEEELARPSLISHATSLKVDGKDIKIEGKEGEVKVILKRGRPLGRVGDKVFPSDSGGGGGAGLFGLNSSNRNSTGTSSTGGSVGAGGVVLAVVPRRGRPPLSKTRGREKDSTAIPTPIATTMNLNTSAGTTSLSTSTTFADSLPFSLPSTCSQLSSPHTDSTSATTFSAPFSSCIIVSPTAHTSSNLNGPMSVEGDCIDNENNCSNNTHSGDVVRVANGRSSSIDHGHESDTDVTVRVNADDERCRTDRHGDNNDSSSNSAGNSLEIDFSMKKEGTSVEGDYYSTFTNMTNIRSANNVTFTSDVEGETSNKSSLSRNESKDASKSLDGKKDKVTLETDSVYTETQLKSFVSDTRGLFILRKFYSEFIRENDDTLGRKENEENKIEIETDKLLLEVYEFWIKKRSGRFSSLLRCYHNFIMKKWGQQEALPPLPEDIGGGNMLKNGYTELLKLRLALEKARILADRVRRREKLKRDLLKLSGEHLDSYFSFLSRGDSSSNSKNSSNIDIEVENEELDEGEIPCSILGKFGTSVLLPFSLEPGNYDVLYEREREKLALNASLALSLKSQEHGEQITERSRERTGSISVLTEGRDRTNSITVHARDLTGNGHGATHWSIEDDRLLLLGVAACGVGRWSEIRSEFELSRNSSQMNQRFTRLIRRRIAGRLSEGCEDSRGLIHAESTRERERERENGSHGGDMSGCSNNTNTRNNSSSSSTGSSGHSHGHGESNSHQSRVSHNNSNGNDITSSYDDDDDHHNETVPEATDLTAIKRILPQSVRLILDCYEEISVWESIAVRYLLDTQNHEKRSGRPVLHPLPIPIPVHLLKGKHVLFLHKLIERPSSVQSNKIQTAAKIIPKSHKKAISSTTSSSTLKFVPMVGAADSTHENLGGGGGGHGSVNYDNYMNNNNTVKSVSHTVVAVPSSSTLSTAAISDYSPEKKSKSKNRKRDRNREKEKRREKDKLRNEVEKRERAMREKEIGDGDIDSNAAVMPSSTVATAIILEKNKKNISGFSTADSSIIHGNLEIMGKRVRSNDIVKKEENDDLAVVSSVNDSEKGIVKGVSRRTRSNHTESGEIFEMLLIPIVKKVEKVKENGEKRSHKKKKVEPKVAVCASLLPSALPTSLPSILPLPCFSSLSYPIQSSILPLDSISPTCITTCAEEDNDVIVMMIVDNNTTAVTPQEEEVEEEEVEDLKEVEIEVVRPSWHSKALSFLGIRCEKDKDENSLKIAEEKRRLCVSGEIVRERERSVTANNEEFFSIVPNISSEGLADEMECFDGKVEKRERERERLGESASGILKDVHFINNDKGDREAKDKDKKKECKKRVRHDVCNGDE